VRLEFAKIILHAKSPSFRAAKLNGFKVITVKTTSAQEQLGTLNKNKNFATSN